MVVGRMATTFWAVQASLIDDLVSRWVSLSVTLHLSLQSCRRQMWPFWQLIRIRRHDMTWPTTIQRHWKKIDKRCYLPYWWICQQRRRRRERFSKLVTIVTQLTIPDKLQNLNHDWIIMRFIDWQSQSDLDSIRNSCDVLCSRGSVLRGNKFK